jgi:hypothetical protein
MYMHIDTYIYIYIYIYIYSQYANGKYGFWMDTEL